MKLGFFVIRQFCEVRKMFVVLLEICDAYDT